MQTVCLFAVVFVSLGRRKIPKDPVWFATCNSIMAGPSTVSSVLGADSGAAHRRGGCLLQVHGRNLAPLSKVTTMLALLLLMPLPVYSWGGEGHEIIAILAEQRLHPDTREKVNALLGAMSVVEAATWADQVRDEQTAPWHYVNIDLAASEYDAARDCLNNQCVVGQIEQFRRVLVDDSGDLRERQRALMYLIHFVGDLHQPLHAGDNHDRGGNDVQVEFLGQRINPYNGKSWNLHAVWDSGLIEARKTVPKVFVERLTIWLRSQPVGAFEDGTVVDWAMESQGVARDNVYVLPEDHNLGEDYYEANVPVVDQQLAKAGVRLAKLLNDALPKK